MLLKLAPVAASLCLLGLMTTPAFAASSTDEQQLIEKLSQQTASLQQEVATLETQVKTLKAGTRAGATTAPAQPRVRKVMHTARNVPAQSVYQNVDMQKSPPATEIHAAQPTPLRTLNDKSTYIGGMPIVTSPFLGKHSAFDASDLIALFPSVGTDLLLLQQHNKIYDIYQQYGLPIPTEPLVNVSGGLEAQYYNQRPYAGGKISNVDLTRSELDIAANINTWATGFMALAYDNSPSATYQTVTNSRVFLDKGFIVLGNLKQSPFYGTIGQYYVPFGRYSSYMVSDSLPKLLGRIKGRAMQLSYDKAAAADEVNFSVFTFKGDQINRPNQSRLNQVGANLDYMLAQTRWNAAVGGSVISNIADSLGMQNNGASSGFTGLSSALSNDALAHRVPAYDLHGSVGVGSYSLLGEYVDTFNAFAPADFTYKNHGASPSALNIEGSYSFPVQAKPSSIALGYSMTKDALALLLPQQRYSTAFNISLIKDTIETIEYRHDINYPGSAFASGQGVAITNNGLGHSSDTLTMQIGVYF